MQWKINMLDNIKKIIKSYDDEVKTCKNILKDLTDSDFNEIILYKTQLSEKRMFIQTLRNLIHNEEIKRD